MAERQNLSRIPVLSFAARTRFGVLLLALAAAPAPAQTPPAPPASEPQTPPPEAPSPVARPSLDGEVEAHVALGHRLSKIGRDEDAIDEFRRAYELRADARLFYEIAESYRRLGATEQARFYYERYLATAPNPPGPSDPDRKVVEDKLAALTGGRPVGRARPRLIPEATVVTPTPPRPPRPWQRWWFWTAIGVALGAGATAIVLSRRSETEVPTTALGDQKFFP
jgi:tetratricopeptide (TPR) repeat protein